jgi:hypothetical protein
VRFKKIQNSKSEESTGAHVHQIPSRKQGHNVLLVIFSYTD